jgi:hypothetical protein
MSKIYYKIIVFPREQKQGKGIEENFQNENEALEKFNKLENSGKFDIIVLRKEEIFKDTKKAFIGISSPIKIYRERELY